MALLGAGFVGTALADEVWAEDPPAKEAPTAFNAPEPAPVLNWGTGDSRSFLVPAYEIPAYELLLNRFDHYEIDAATYPPPWTNLKTNLQRWKPRLVARARCRSSFTLDRVQPPGLREALLTGL